MKLIVLNSIDRHRTSLSQTGVVGGGKNRFEKKNVVFE